GLSSSPGSWPHRRARDRRPRRRRPRPAVASATRLRRLCCFDSWLACRPSLLPRIAARRLPCGYSMGRGPNSGQTIYLFPSTTAAISHYDSRSFQSSALTIRYWLLSGSDESLSYTKPQACWSKFSNHSSQLIGLNAPTPGKLNLMPAPPSLTVNVAGPEPVASPVAGAAWRSVAHCLINSWSRVKTACVAPRNGTSSDLMLRARGSSADCLDVMTPPSS